MNGPGVLVAADRIRDDAPVPPATIHVVSSRTLARSLAAAGNAVCLASPAALPIRDGATAHIHLDRSAAAHDLPDRLREAARIAAPEASIRLSVALRSGFAGFWRRLLAAVLPAARPRDPQEVARDLVLSGFDRVSQELSGSIGHFVARRLPGRFTNSR